uniref:ribosomal oxygenase 1-like isoform X2 n=1 Tax=Styela clava TaxID=7725 RepID=UPI001939768F|nr:ribosomal oxygenase 1-like isoform X2 [Styela clava]
MVKTYKLCNQRATSENLPQASAFSVYRSVTSIKSDNLVDDAASSNMQMTSKEIKSIPQTSSAFIKHISNKAALPFRRSSRKRKKKLKRGNEPQTEEEWKRSNMPNEASKISPLVSSESMEKPSVFPFGRFRASMYLDKKLNKQTTGPRIYENHKAGVTFREFEECQIPIKHPPKRVYKDDKSIELSTSQSLTGYEDNDTEESSNIGLMTPNENLDPNSNNLKVKSHEQMEFCANILNESTSPIQKKARVDTEDEDQSIETYHCSTDKSSSRRSSPVHAVNTTNATMSVQKANSKILKMPFPAGNSEEDGKMLFKWLIHPMSDKHFMNTIWEKKPALIRRRIPTYVSGLFSMEEFNRILHECNVQYGVNLDVTSYTDGVRETHNLEGKVFPVVAWDNYKNGCSLRIKNPQAFSKPVWKLCATLQEYFKNMVGSNIYLTPSGTQGFAPHYDDIEAFVLQLEGKKHWHLYNPKSDAETLPRYSSGNFTNEDIGEQIFDAVLEPGDLLYFPRGYLHQAQAVPDAHSLHITISTYQRNTWADVLEDLVPKALQKAVEENIEFRKGLPRDYLSCFGHQNIQSAKPERRKEILSKLSQFFAQLADYADCDENADERAKSFLHDCLPPALTQDERSRTVLAATVRLKSLGQPGSCECDIDLNSKVRVIRKNAVRLVKDKEEAGKDDSTYFVYHSMQNPRTYHTEEQKYFAITEACVPVIQFLINSYPEYKAVNSFPLQTNDEKLDVACGLFEKGVLLLKDKVKILDEHINGTVV